MAIKGLDSRVKNAKFYNGSLEILRIRINITESWIMVYGSPRRSQHRTIIWQCEEII